MALSAPPSATADRPGIARTASAGANLLPQVEPLSPFEASFLSTTPVREWKKEEIKEWLTSMNCQEYLEKFVDNDIDGSVLLDLGKPELRQLVSRVGDRIRIHQAVLRLKRQAVNAEPQPSPRQGYFAGVDAFNSDKPDQGSIRFVYTDGKSRFVNVTGSQTAADIKRRALRKVFPSISDSALVNWSVLRDGTALSDAELLELSRYPLSNLVLSLQAARAATQTAAPVPRRLIATSRHRPTSQHVSAHLSEYFPGVDSGELEETVRNSILVSRRLSVVDHHRFSRRTSNMIIPEKIPEKTFFEANQAPSLPRIVPSRGASRQFGATVSKRLSSLNSRGNKSEESLDSTASSAFQGVSYPSASSVSSVPNTHYSPTTSNATRLAESHQEARVDDREFMDRFTREELSPTRWIKGQVIGSGTFGTVYMAMNAFNGELLAVKQVELPKGAGIDEQRKKKMIEAMRREIALLRDFDHENIVQYRGFKNEDNMLNIFLEYVPGGSLSSILNQYGPFEEDLVRRYVRQTLAGLAYLHERNVIHRDIKGANILVNDRGQIKISDFGLSKKLETEQLLNNRQSMQGSAFWMAPEVVKTVGTTVKADIWSLGCLVIELLTGTHPFPQLNQMQALFKLGNSVKPTIPEEASSELQDFLSKTLEIDSNARPSAEQLRHHEFIVGGGSS